MTKKQRIWFTVFWTMFLVPEVLWGLIGNFLYNIIRFTMGFDESKIFYSLFQFPDSSQTRLPLILIILIQILGLLGIAYNIVLICKIKKIFKYSIMLFLLIMILVGLSFLSFILNFNPQIG